MCRNIKNLRTPDHKPTEAELHEAALQFVRKVSGYHKPSLANRQAFDRAVDQIVLATRQLFDELVSYHPPRSSPDTPHDRIT
jgi:hypothetical protein